MVMIVFYTRKKNTAPFTSVVSMSLAPTINLEAFMNKGDIANQFALFICVRDPDASDVLDDKLEQLTSPPLIEEEDSLTQPFDEQCAQGWSSEDIPPENVTVSEPPASPPVNSRIDWSALEDLTEDPPTDHEEVIYPESPSVFQRDTPRDNFVTNDTWLPVHSGDLIVEDVVPMNIDDAMPSEEDLEDYFDQKLEVDMTVDGYWTKNELDEILVVIDPPEQPGADVFSPRATPMKGQRKSDHGWLSKRQWQKGRDNRLARHTTRAELNFITRRHNVTC